MPAFLLWITLRVLQLCSHPFHLHELLSWPLIDPSVCLKASLHSWASLTHFIGFPHLFPSFLAFQAFWRCFQLLARLPNIPYSLSALLGPPMQYPSCSWMWVLLEALSLICSAWIFAAHALSHIESLIVSAPRCPSVTILFILLISATSHLHPHLPPVAKQGPSQCLFSLFCLPFFLCFPLNCRVCWFFWGLSPII